MKDTIYSREQYLRKKAAEKEPLNIQLTNNYAFRKLFKMNYIARGFLIALLGLDEEDVVKKKVMSMFTDPNHLRVEDPGQVEGNPVFIYLDAFCKDEYFEEFWPEYKNLDELKAHYQRGGLGDVKVKKFLNKVLQAELAPIRARRKEWEQKLPEVFAILKEGSKAAEAKAAETLQDVKAAMRINYFDDADFLN